MELALFFVCEELVNIRKIIFLVEIENAKFLVIKRSDKYVLPVLDEFDLENGLENVFSDKYQFNIRNMLYIFEDEQLVLIKCRVDGNYNKTKYFDDILNNIYPNLYYLYQQNAIEIILRNIHMELLNDSIWLGILLDAKVKVENIYLKTVISSFVLFFSSLFCDEVINYGFADVVFNPKVNQKNIKELRNYYLKECPAIDSTKTKKIIESMGINLNEYVFDICVYTNNGELLDINSRTWDDRYKDNLDLFNGIVLSPRNWVKNMFPELEYEYNSVRRYYVDYFRSSFSRINIECKTYSSYKLLNSDIDDSSKIYILQRIGLLKVVMFISEMFFNSFNIKTTNGFDVSFDKFIRKSKATLIVMLGADKEKIPILKQILSKYDNPEYGTFFQINRKCRNNLHYGFNNVLNDDEISLLDKEQDAYLNYVINEFEKYIKLKFNFSYYLLLGLAHILEWSSK